MTEEMGATAQPPEENARSRRLRLRWLLFGALLVLGVIAWRDLFRTPFGKPEPLSWPPAELEPHLTPVVHPFRGKAGLTGSIRDAEGERVANVWIHLHMEEQVFLAEASTDVRGEFELRDLPEGAGVILVGAPGYRVTRREVELAKDRVTRLELTAQRIPLPSRSIEQPDRNAETGRIIGLCVSSLGTETRYTLDLAPEEDLVQGTRIVARSELRSGRFELNRVLPGTYRLRVYPRRGEIDGSLVLFERTGIVLNAGQTLELDLEIPLGKVVGRALDQDREPLSNVAITAFWRAEVEPPKFVGRLVTDANGRFWLPELPRGTVELYATKEGLQGALASTSISPGQTAQETVIILKPR